MKIMYVVHSLVIGGAESVAVNYLCRLKQMGEDVVLLQMQDEHTFLNEKLQKERIRVLTASSNRKMGICGKIIAAYRFNRFIKTEKPDVIHVHTGLEKFRFTKYPAEKIVFKLYSEWNRCKAYGKNHRKMLFSLIEQGMQLVALSEKAEMDVLREFPNAKVCVIPNGVQIDEIRKNRYDREEFRGQIGIPKNAFVMGHVGRFHPVKNHEKLIAVFGEVLKRRKDAYLVLVGDGDDKERQNLHEMTDVEGLRGHVRYLGIRQDATAIMSTFDTFVLPSYSEAMPNTLLEAQTLGIRAITSDAVPLKACCNSNCIRLNLRESDAVWAQEILGKSNANYEHKIEEFDIKCVLMKYRDLYRSLC